VLLVFFAQFVHSFVVVDDGLIILFLDYVELSEHVVHRLGTELEVGLDFGDPFLIHLVECFENVPDFEIVDGDFIVQVFFDCVGDEQ
jgi:hypothetical protein